MVTFSHLDPGTAEDVWTDAFRSAALPRAHTRFASLLVVSAHPDDETLGVGGLIRLAALRGCEVRVVVATDGENSHPDSPTVGPHDLARIRRDEVRGAVGALAPSAEVTFLGLRDGSLRDDSDALERAVGDGIRSLAGPVLVVSPWAGDGHGDHRIASEASAAAARGTGAAHREYPLWLWHWGAPADAPWQRMERVALDDETRRAKREAVRMHRSQSRAFSPAPGDEAILSERMLQHFDRSFEVLVTPPPTLPSQPARRARTARVSGSTPRAWFDGFYARHDDPWGFDSRWYEQRKRELLLAVLPRARYRTALELGCSTGALTARLADRCEHLLAVDFAPAALDAARERLGAREGVDLRQADLPGDWPEGRFDLVVFSELGYYWDAVDLERAIARMVASLRPGGHLVACHWRHHVPENPVTGDGVHVALRTQSALTTLVHHEEQDFQLEVFGAAPALSVAAESGLL